MQTSKQIELILHNSVYLDRKSLELGYPVPLIPHIVYTSQTINQIYKESGITHQLQSESTRKLIHSLLYLISQQSSELHVLQVSGIIFQLKGYPELILEHQGSLAKNVLIIYLDSLDLDSLDLHLPKTSWYSYAIYSGLLITSIILGYKYIKASKIKCTNEAIQYYIKYKSIFESNKEIFKEKLKSFRPMNI